MSLQIWLPLTGSTTQQGLSSITMTGSPNSWVAGKLGQCAHFAGSTSNCIYNNTTELNYTDNFSYAVWLKHNYSSGSGTQYAFTVGRADTGGYGYSIAIGSSYIITRFGNKTVSVNCPQNEWHHVAVTISGTTMKTYMDGVLVNISANATPPTYSDGNGLGLGCFHYSGNIYPYYGDLQDFRIYDHCLSPKEVEILARGLVLHYPMTGGGRSGDNLVIDSQNLYTGSSVSTKYIGCRGGNRQLRDDGFYESKSTALWQGLSTWSNAQNFVVGDIITYSFYTYISGSAHEVSFYPMMYNSAGTRDTTTKLPISVDGSSFVSGNARSIGTISSTTPEFHYVTFEWNSAVKSIIDNGGRIELSIQASSGSWTNSSISFFKPKLERGSKPTPWQPNSADAEYTSMGYNSTTEYDVSGYGYNGTRNGTFSWSSDTPRYNVSTYFDGNTASITVPFNSAIPSGTQFTINHWFKKHELGSKNYETFFGGPSGFESDSRAGAATTLSWYMANTRGGVVYTRFNFDQWYMLTIVDDGTNELYYVNGELVKTIARKGMPTGNYFIGAWSTSAQQNYKGLISDFRIYATALTSTQVAELYNTAVSLSNNGALLGYELIEN